MPSENRKLSKEAAENSVKQFIPKALPHSYQQEKKKISEPGDQTEETMNGCPRKISREEIFAKTADKPNTGNNTIDQAIRLRSEQELQLMLGKKEQNLAYLQQQNGVLVKDIKQLEWGSIEAKRGLNYNASWLLQAELWLTANAPECDQLEQCLIDETKKRELVETCLAKEKEEMSKVRSALAQAENDSKESQSHWEHETSRRLQEHLQETSSLTAALTRSQEELEAKRSLWNQTRLELLEPIRAAKQAVDREVEVTKKFRDDLEKRIQTMENQLKLWNWNKVRLRVVIGLVSDSLSTLWSQTCWLFFFPFCFAHL